MEKAEAGKMCLTLYLSITFPLSGTKFTLLKVHWKNVQNTHQSYMIKGENEN